MPAGQFQTRSIRSFIKRSGRLTPGQRRALDDLLPHYGLKPGDIIRRKGSGVFEQSGPIILEIGFGDGEALVETAALMTGHNFVGVEVYEPGVGHLLLQLERQELDNVRISCLDVVDFLREQVEQESLQQIRIFFPDPWPKKKHHKRRIIQTSFVDLMVSRLVPGGEIHFATDWEDYAEEALHNFAQSEQLENPAGRGRFSPRPDNRPETKFEKRGLRLGHGVWDIVMQKTG